MRSSQRALRYSGGALHSPAQHRVEPNQDGSLLLGWLSAYDPTAPAVRRSCQTDAQKLHRVEKDGLLSYICKLCGGVPRAKYYAHSRYTHKPLHLFYEVDKSNMTNIWLDEADVPVLTACFQDCWAETDFTDSALLCGEPVSAVVAQLGGLPAA